METKLIKYNNPNICCFDGFRLIPGVNRISVEQWKVVERLQAAKVSAGVIQDVTPKQHNNSSSSEEPAATKKGRGRPRKAATASASAPKPGGELAAMEEAEAIALVKDTVDVVLLQEWEKGEKRKKVAKAIGDQLQALELPFPEKEADNDDVKGLF